MSIYFNINTIIELCKPIHEARLSRDLEAIQQEMAYACEELATLAEGLRFLSAGGGEDSVFWLDWGADGALREMCGSPLEVDRPFADYLEGILGSAVFTSATLSQNGSFALLRDRLGMRFLASKPRELVIPSPFPFDENCLVLVVSGLGDPNRDGFAAPVARARRRARRRDRAQDDGALHLVSALQFRRGSVSRTAASNAPFSCRGRERAGKRCRESCAGIEGGVLLGVASFWEGVDFPGEELEVLVIPKIPFPVPAEPIVEARSQRLSSLGEDPFEKLFLPEAILRMRQGSGRLIRRMSDRGVIVILDSRLGGQAVRGDDSLVAAVEEHRARDGRGVRRARRAVVRGNAERSFGVAQPAQKPYRQSGNSRIPEVRILCTSESSERRGEPRSAARAGSRRRRSACS